MAETTIESIRPVGADTIAIELRTPPEFTAEPGQFVLIRAEVADEEETGYYTLSSPNVDDTFEITVAVDPDGTLGPWLERRNVGDSVRFDGPYGDVTYDGQGGVIVLAKGPGIGPAIGIAERATAANESATILYEGENPPHSDRLKALQSDGATVISVDDAVQMSDHLTEHSTGKRTYVFGFDTFVDEVKTALEDAGIDSDSIGIENFGPA